MFETIREMIVNALGVKEEDVKETSSFKEDLGADSLDLFELVMAMEDEFGVEIPSEDLENMIRVGDVMKYIKEKKAEN